MKSAQRLQAEKTAPVPALSRYFKNFLIWARYLFNFNGLLLMPSVSKAAFQKTCQRYVRDANFKLQNNYKYTTAENIDFFSKEVVHK